MAKVAKQGSISFLFTKSCLGGLEMAQSLAPISWGPLPKLGQKESALNITTLLMESEQTEIIK